MCDLDKSKTIDSLNVLIIVHQQGEHRSAHNRRLEFKSLRVFLLVFDPGFGFRLTFQESFLFEENPGSTVGNVARPVLFFARHELIHRIGIDSTERTTKGGLGNSILCQKVFDFLDNLGTSVIDPFLGNFRCVMSHDTIHQRLHVSFGRLFDWSVSRRGLPSRFALFGFLWFVSLRLQETSRGPVGSILRRRPRILVRFGIHESTKRIGIDAEFFHDGSLRLIGRVVNVPL
mmetsp:Transcript_1789/g.2961  ORF Transcript_1789/g.2961 Transcript_1789/m.2961 type:complete len:231 (-) Transcript_1789:218-910(-)